MPRHQPITGPLTVRELQVLTLLLEDGMTNKVIAARLAIEDHTVKFHLNGVMRKLGATTRTGAVVAGLKSKVISL